MYLNVFKPLAATPESKLPVLVWFHGGGGGFGSTAQSVPTLYNVNLLAKTRLF